MGCPFRFLYGTKGSVLHRTRGTREPDRSGWGSDFIVGRVLKR